MPFSYKTKSGQLHSVLINEVVGKVYKNPNVIEVLLQLRRSRVKPAEKNRTPFCVPQAPVTTRETRSNKWCTRSKKWYLRRLPSDTAAAKGLTASKDTAAIADTHVSDLISEENKFNYEESPQLKQSDFQSAATTNTNQIYLYRGDPSPATYDKYI